MLWIFAAFVAGISLWAGVYWYTNGGADGPPLLVAVGRAGLTLAFGGVLGGLVKRLFDDWEERKADAEARTAYIAQLLEDFKTVYNTVERARFLITAHKSAKTYGEQMRRLPDAIILLHNVKRSAKQGFPKLYVDLSEPILHCTIFLKKLVEEYRDEYLKVSRLQSQDEADNKALREAITDGDKPRDSTLSHRGWEEIADLDNVKVLLDATQEDASKGEHEAFQTYEEAFVQYIDIASHALMLRMPGNEEVDRESEVHGELLKHRKVAEEKIAAAKKAREEARKAKAD